MAFPAIAGIGSDFCVFGVTGVEMICPVVISRSSCDILATDGASMAGTACGDHVVVLLEHNVAAVVVIQQADGRQVVGYAARAHDVFVQSKPVYDALHRRMVRRLQILSQRKRARTFAIVCVVHFRRYYPVPPTDLLNIDEQLVTSALARAAGVIRRPLRQLDPPFFLPVLPPPSVAPPGFLTFLIAL